MSNGPIVQCLGFKAKPEVHEYTFSVREVGEEREFRFNIANEAFLSHRARYHDAPGIYAVRLPAELAAFSNHPSETQYEITVTELDSYRNSHAPQVAQSRWGRKAQDNF